MACGTVVVISLQFSVENVRLTIKVLSWNNNLLVKLHSFVSKLGVLVNRFYTHSHVYTCFVPCVIALCVVQTSPRNAAIVC